MINRIIITFLIMTICNATALAGADTDSMYYITRDNVKHVFVEEDVKKKGKDSFSIKNGKMYAVSDIIANGYPLKKKGKIVMIEYRKIGIKWSTKLVSGRINIYGHEEVGSKYNPAKERMDSETEHTYHIQKGDFDEPIGLKASGVHNKSGEYTDDEVYKMFSDHAAAKAILDASIEKKKYISMDAIREAAKVYNGQ